MLYPQIPFYNLSFSRISFIYDDFKHRRVSLEEMYERSMAKLIRNMSDSDLWDMHCFLTEDDDRNGDEPEEGFYINLFQ